MFDKAVKASKKQFGKQKMVTVYKAKKKNGDNSVQCIVEDSSGSSKVFKLPVVKKEIFSCDSCDKTFTIQRHLKNHCKRDHAVDIDVDCMEKSPHEGIDNVERSESEAKVYHCDQCSCMYSRLSSLKQHQRLKHGVKFEEKEKIACDICGGKYDTRHHLELHQADKHGKVEGVEGELHECKYCKLRFPTFRALRLHKRHHETHTNHVCEVCGKGFLRMDSLKSHHKFVHQGVKRYINSEKKFVCEICGNRFFRRSNLKEHCLVKHSNEPLNHKCEHCEKTFIRPSALEYHVNKVHLKMRPYTCDKCQKMFYSRHSIHDHKVVCNMAPEKKISCEVCGKLFTSQHNYKLHRQAIHSTPALVCPCGTVVRWQSSVTKHKRRCSLYNNKAQRGRKKQLRYEGDTEECTVQTDSVVYLQETYTEGTVLEEMATTSDGRTAVMVSEAEGLVAENVDRLLQSIPQDVLGVKTDRQGGAEKDGQGADTGEATYSNVSVVTEDGQDSQKIYYVIQY